jgi:L-idonate 5-dehydrogenase
MKAAVLYGPRDIRVEPLRNPELGAGMVLLRNRRVGICGSDQHYFEHGYCAAFVPDRPFVLGHEVMAVVEAVGAGVDRVRAGDRVAVNPARACGFCEACKAGRGNLCTKTIMLGSASTTPPTNGGLAEYVTVREDQCHALPDGVDEDLGAMMEPFAVALHAVKRAGTVAGRRVMVTGAGAIGLLAALTARAFGAAPVAISDLVRERRAKAEELGLGAGMDAVLDPAASDFQERARELSGGGFDFVFEASGAPPALRSAFTLVRPGGTIVQIGTLGTADIPLPANLLMNKEISLIGSMRYGNVFDEAIRLVAAGRVNLRPLINAVFPLEQSLEAFEFAADKVRSFKVQIEIPV